jgi:2-amino-4-hydroxy-6-hydroxymethyldihydropteridine diphosphokinase
MNRAVVSVGSNIDPRRHVAGALRAMARGQRLLARSRFLWTLPVGRKGQGRFLNGGVLLETGLSKARLRAWLKDLEVRLHRTRAADKSAPRTIDLDLVVWNGKVINGDVYRRDFLRRAVEEVCPDLDLTARRARPAGKAAARGRRT